MLHQVSRNWELRKSKFRVILMRLERMNSTLGYLLMQMGLTQSESLQQVKLPPQRGPSSAVGLTAAAVD